jgi:hypothetical protein
MLPRKSSGFLFADCAGAGADQRSASASIVAPVRLMGHFVCRVIFHPQGRLNLPLSKPGHGFQ